MDSTIVFGAYALLLVAAGVSPWIASARGRRRWKAALAALGFSEAGPRTAEQQSKWEMFSKRGESEVYVGQQDFPFGESRKTATYVDVFFSSPLELSLTLSRYNPKDRSFLAYGDDPDEIQALRLSELLDNLPIDTTVELDDTKVRLRLFYFDSSRLEAAIETTEGLAQKISKARESLPTHVHGEHLAKAWKKSAAKHQFEYIVADCEMHRSTPAGSITIGDWLNKRNWETYISIDLWSSHPDVNQSALGLKETETESETPSVRAALAVLRQGLGRTIESFSCELEHIAIELKFSLGDGEGIKILERLMENLLALTDALGNLETSSFGPFRSAPRENRRGNVRPPRKPLPPPAKCSECSKDLSPSELHTKNETVFCETCFWRHY